MSSDYLHLLQVVAITVGLAVMIWFGVLFMMEGASGLLKGFFRMLRRDENKIERRTFPAIAWGITGLVCGLFLVLVIAKCTQG